MDTASHYVRVVGRLRRDAVRRIARHGNERVADSGGGLHD